MQNLTAALLQADLVWEDKQANLSKFEHMIAHDVPDGIDLIVLPEMFTTGFSMNSEKLAEPVDGPAVKWMMQQAEKKQAAVVGSLIIQQDWNYYNRLFWVNPDGSYEEYNKRHLFSMAGEQNHYTAGDRKLIVDYKGWKFCTQICYDLRFPAWNRNQEDYDCLLIIANWPEVRIMHWTPLAIARAIENQSYVLAVNRVGVDGSGKKHNGMSLACNPMGELICSSENEEKVMVVTLQRDVIDDVRGRLPFLQDRDTYRI
ncbi:amidohydrolase [Bacteroidota bacterium]